MPFHLPYREQFLRRAADSADILGSATPYRVGFEPATVATDQPYWRVIGVHHLAPAENRGKHVIYVDAVDEQGQRVRDPNLRLGWGWAGQRADESVAPRAFDKGADEPAANVDVWRGQQTWVQVQGDGLPSDRVFNLHTDHPDELGPQGEAWNSVGHHSFYVVFQRTRKAATGVTIEPGVVTQPPVEPPPPPATRPSPPATHTGNRLGFYLHLSFDQHGLWEAINRVQPPVLLIHADTANRMLLQEIRRFRAPNAFVIGRVYKDVHTQRSMLESNDPAGQGRALAEEILRYDFGLATQRGENGRLLIDAWMSLNEAVPGPASRQFAERPEETARLLHAYDRFQVAFHQRLQEAGVEAVAFNFGAGNFSEPAHYLDHFPGTLAAYTYLGFHEYGWPALDPAGGVASSGGLYRRCLEGIRAKYGDRHRVIITEAGLTRMYKDPTLGDVGWLNPQTPLNEEEYWRSLAWYNQHLLHDPYVLGACLFEVGHHGDWASFRHLGRDNQGQPIHLIDRMAALNTVVQPQADIAPAPQPTRPPLTIRGKVSLNGRSVAGATVRLIGAMETVGSQRHASLHAPSYITWTREVSGFRGSLWQCWVKLVRDHAAGLSWAEFKRDAITFNPTLAADNYQLRANQSYRLPENKGLNLPIAWDRPLTGFSGSAWACWQQLVVNRVVGLDYATFKRELLRHNPHLAERLFQADQRYNLPRNTGHKEYVLTTTSDRRGHYRFTGLPPGEYRLTVSAPNALLFTSEFSCVGDITVDAPLQPLNLPQPAAPEGVAMDVAAHSLAGVRGSEFVVNNRAFRFIGVNIRGLVHYGDSRVLQHSSRNHQGEQLQAAYDMGARVVRLFLPAIHSPVNETIDRLRGVVDLVRSRFPGLYLLPAFANLYGDVPFRIPGDEGFYTPPPNYHIHLLNADFYRRGYEQNYLPYLRHVVSAFRDEPVIFAWEVGNELKLDPATGPHPGDPHLAAFLSFMHRAAQEIRNLDPNHLITTGMISTRHASLASDTLKRQLYDTPLFDFLTTHCYNEEYHEDDSGLAQALNKPFIVEEAGFSRGFKHGDRAALTRSDLDFWFNRGARGYMPWGFMGTSHDMGDGDGDAGLDRALHGDWDPLFNLFRQRAGDLARFDSGHLEPQRPGKPAQPPKPAPFQPGQQVFAQDHVNVRKSPGHRNKLGDDILGQLAPGTAGTITGAATPKDDLTWYPVRGPLSNGQTVDGWAAQSVGGSTLLAPTAPAQAMQDVGLIAPQRQTGGTFQLGQQIFAATYVNVRRDPGYVGKPGDHVIGQIPYGAAITVLNGPEPADGLTWWQVRAPLLDNSVGEGWAAEIDPDGETLLRPAPPAPPAPPTPGVSGEQFQPGTAIMVVADLVNLRRSPGYVNQPADHVLAMVARGERFTIRGGPEGRDGLKWWQVVDGQNRAGWLALAGPDGQRYLVDAAKAEAIRVGPPFSGHGPLSQGWGQWPEFYSTITYDGVPLKGHNGLDFATTVGTPLLAVDAGEVIKVDFEPEGFGQHLVIRHTWGESLYAHLERIDVPVHAQVAARQTIGATGETGKCFGAHLHFGVRVFPYQRTDGWGGFCDPSAFLDPMVLSMPQAAPLPPGVRRPRRRRARPASMAPELVGRRRP